MFQYRNNDYHKFNAYKGHENPNATSMSLDTARRQLSSNPCGREKSRSTLAIFSSLSVEHVTASLSIWFAFLKSYGINRLLLL